jgi:hypothetical protein
MVKCTMTLTIASLLLLGGCNWKADGPERLQRLYPQDDLVSKPPPLDVPPALDLPDTPYEPGQDIQLNKLWGYYVVEMKLPATMEFFPGNPPYALSLTNLFVASWSDDGLEWEYCTQRAKIDAGGLGDTEMLPATDAAIGAAMITLDTQEGIGITDQKIAWTWGLQNMADPLTDPLPTEPDDPRVWDQDEDGHPGVTIKVLQPPGYRYMVRRAVWTIKPATITPGASRIEGTLDFTIDEGAVGHDGPNSLATIIPIVPDADGGTYTLVRTTEYYSCQQLLAEYPGIF